MTISEVVAKRLKLFSRKRVLTLLEGNYDSLFRGRSVDFASLREYVPGDNIRDIDWASTARTSTVQTKLYAPQRDQKFLVVADLSPSMLIAGDKDLNKIESVMALIIMIGAFVRKNNDQMAITGYDGRKIVHTRYGHSSDHLERLLRTYDTVVHQRVQKPDLLAMLESIRHSDRTKSSLLIVSDEMPNPDALASMLSRLRKRHQLFYIHLPPAAPLSPHMPRGGLVDIESGQRLNLPLGHSAQLQKEWDVQVDQWRKGWQKICRASGTCHTSLTVAEEMPAALQTLFIQAKRYARR